MIVYPNAKINLGLNILRRRPDGYHDIETLMVSVPWRDILEIVPSSGTGTTLTVSGRAVGCPPEKNLVMKAYRALAATVDIPPVDIYLHKIIPDEARPRRRLGRRGLHTHMPQRAFRPRS